MLAFLYILLALATGTAIVSPVILGNEDPAPDRPVNRIWILLGSAAAAGTLTVTWCLYLIAWVLKVRAGVLQPLYIANAVVMGGEAAVFIFLLIRLKKAGGAAAQLKRLVPDRERFKNECILYAILLVFITATFWYVLFVRDNRLYAGLTVFSDYAPHLAMVRSFSRSANYPTMYPHFGGEDIKYHFMFQFLTGNLEFLGMRLDVAYNVAGILFMWTFLIVLTQIALRLWGRFAAAVLTTILFFFRSGLTFFRFLIEHISAGDLMQTLAENRTFIGYTTNENWGLWNYNVYLNQRHLAFGLTVAGLLIWFFLDYLIRAEETGDCAENEPAQPVKPAGPGAAASSAQAAKTAGPHAAASPPKQTGAAASPAQAAKAAGPHAAASPSKQTGAAASPAQAAKAAGSHVSASPSKHTGAAASRLSFLFLTKDAWLPEHPWKAILLGSLLGLAAFWNGAAVIGCLLILLGFTFYSRHKLDYALTAGCAVVISYLQTKFFIRGSAVSAGLYWGFISEDKSLPGIGLFLLYISGLTILGAFVLLFFLRRERQTYLTATFLPVFFTFTMSLTPDVTVNQKYIMIACAFMAPIWGGVLARLFAADRRKAASRAAAVLLTVALTAMGIYDFVVILRDNGPDYSVTVSLESDLTDWLDGTMRPDQLILTPWYSLCDVTLSGKMLYMGWPYYAWSAGYNTDYRGRMGELIYTARDEELFRQVVAQEKISYILFEDGMTINDSLAREDVIASVCRLLYTSEDGRIRVYETDFPSFYK